MTATVVDTYNKGFKDYFDKHHANDGMYKLFIKYTLSDGNIKHLLYNHIIKNHRDQQLSNDIYTYIFNLYPPLKYYYEQNNILKQKYNKIMNSLGDAWIYYLLCVHVNDVQINIQFYTCILLILEVSSNKSTHDFNFHIHNKQGLSVMYTNMMEAKNKVYTHEKFINPQNFLDLLKNEYKTLKIDPYNSFLKWVNLKKPGFPFSSDVKDFQCGTNTTIYNLIISQTTNSNKPKLIYDINALIFKKFVPTVKNSKNYIFFPSIYGVSDLSHKLAYNLIEYTHSSDITQKIYDYYGSLVEEYIDDYNDIHKPFKLDISFKYTPKNIITSRNYISGIRDNFVVPVFGEIMTGLKKHVYIEGNIIKNGTLAINYNEIKKAGIDQTVFTDVYLAFVKKLNELYDKLMELDVNYVDSYETRIGRFTYHIFIYFNKNIPVNIKKYVEMKNKTPSPESTIVNHIKKFIESIPYSSVKKIADKLHLFNIDDKSENSNKVIIQNFTDAIGNIFGEKKGDIIDSIKTSNVEFYNILKTSKNKKVETIFPMNVITNNSLKEEIKDEKKESKKLSEKIKKEADEKAAALKKEQEEKIKKEADEKAAALKKEQEEKIKKEADEKAAALKKEQEKIKKEADEKAAEAAALKKEQEKLKKQEEKLKKEATADGINSEYLHLLSSYVNDNIYKNTTEYLIKYLTKINEESNNPTVKDLLNSLDNIDFNINTDEKKKFTTDTTGNNINDPNEFKVMVYDEFYDESDDESDNKSNSKSANKSNSESDNGTFNEKLKKLLPTNTTNKNNNSNKINNLKTPQFPTIGGSINSDDFTFLTEDISETEDFGF